MSPSSGLVRLLPGASFDRIIDNLVFGYGGSVRSFSDVAVADVSQRNFDGRESFRWSAVVQDRRWKWRYPRISGEYNRRLCDGSVDPKGKKNVRELAELISTELGGVDVSSLPTNAWPYVKWDDAIARFELAWLGDLFGQVVCPKANDTFAMEPIMQSASLPAGGVPITPPAFAFKPSIMPSALKVQGSRDMKQGWVPLQAIGLDSDGQYKLIGVLSYSYGWSTQWPHAFPGVAQADRHLAFQTVFRLYAPTDPTIILEDHTLESGLDVPADRKRCLPPQLRGAFYSHDDFGTTTSATATFTGEWRIRKDLNAVEVAYPAYRFLDGGIVPAALEVNTGYHVVDTDGNPTGAYEKVNAVPEARRTTKDRVLRHPELGKREIIASLYGTALGDNTSTLDGEAQSYLDAVSSGYSYQQCQDVLFDGILQDGLSGGVSQMLFRLGSGRVATTRVGVNHEFDIHQMHLQQRRAQERLSQMAERMGV